MQSHKYKFKCNLINIKNGAIVAWMFHNFPSHALVSTRHLQMFGVAQFIRPQIQLLSWVQLLPYMVEGGAKAPIVKAHEKGLVC